MGIARRGDSPAVQIAGLVQFAQFFESLSAMVVSSGIVGIRLENGLEFLNGAIQVAGADMLHRQPITREGIGGVVGQEQPERI